MNTQLFEFDRRLCWFIFLCLAVVSLGYHRYAFSEISAVSLSKPTCYPSCKLGSSSGQASQFGYFDISVPGYEGGYLIVTPFYPRHDRKYPVVVQVSIVPEIGPPFFYQSPAPSNQAQKIPIDAGFFPAQVKVNMRIAGADGSADFNDCAGTWGVTRVFGMPEIPKVAVILGDSN